MPSRSRLDTALDCHRSRNGESVIMPVIHKEQDQAEGQNANSPVVSPAQWQSQSWVSSAGPGGAQEASSKGSGRGRHQTPAYQAESTENSSIVGTVPRVRWMGRWLMQGRAGSLPRVGETGRKGAATSACLGGAQVPPAYRTTAGKVIPVGGTGRASVQARERVEGTNKEEGTSTYATTTDPTALDV